MSGTQNFLGRIVETKRQRLARAMTKRSLEEMRAVARDSRRTSKPHALRSALARDERFNIIAEIKRASPSKGDIRADIAPAEVACEYEAGGAAAISVLTEEDYFRGSLADLRAVREAVALPLLRKDFIFDDWQVYEAAQAGADALLLIVAALDDETITRLRRLTEDELSMDALVEVHTVEELRRAERCGARIIGVNNRNLHTFEVSLDVSVQLAQAARTDALLVSESGLRTREDLNALKSQGFAGFLIGETLMRAEHPAEELHALLAEI